MSVQVNGVAATGHGTQVLEGGALEEFEGVLGMAAAPMKRGNTGRTRRPESDNDGDRDALKAAAEYGD